MPPRPHLAAWNETQHFKPNRALPGLAPRRSGGFHGGPCTVVAAVGFRIWHCLCAGALLGSLSGLCAGAEPNATNTFEEVLHAKHPGYVVMTNGEVRFLSVNATDAPPPASLDQKLDSGEGLRTGDFGRATVSLITGPKIGLRRLTQLRIERSDSGGPLSIGLTHGGLYINTHGQPQTVRIKTPQVSGQPHGTEFLIEVDSTANRTEVTMFDGEVELSNAFGPPLQVTKGWQAVAESNQAPRLVARIAAKNLVQWWIYYPGVLDPNELELAAADREELAASLTAYRQGDLRRALELDPDYPASAAPRTDARRCYLAALLLGVGAVDLARTQLNQTNPHASLVRALNLMIQAVTGQSTNTLQLSSALPAPATASELLALSYAYQATHDLKPALSLARAAVTNSPDFGFGWARVAELEFSFGRTRAAREAVQRALALSPQNAQAHALNGFLLAAENRIPVALEAFGEAIRLDSALANGWLGRGLCRIRLGETRAGREDLQTAALLEPHRSLLRSYAGKALSDAGDPVQARKELAYAGKLDENDPTPWLYSALEKWRENLVNAAIADLEKSQALNDNRSLFRSRLLLDQDRAVRSANLAGVYRDAGMTETSLQEAAHAVTYDYANDSAHLFISDSFNELRDPTRFNLRYETVWFSELLLANLLAPVGAGRLSQNVSQQEYSKLFEADGMGIANDTFARSDGQVWERASQFGTFRNTEWALDFDYQHNNGVRPNNDLDRFEWYTTVKQQLTPQDTALLLVKYENYSSGDNFQYYDPLDPKYGYRPNFRFEEHQEPILIGGYQHEWSPGIRTLLLGGRLVNEQKFSDLQSPQPALFEWPSGEVSDAYSFPFDVQLTDKLEIYTAELNQIFQIDRLAVVVGTLWQGGDFTFANSLSNGPYATPPVNASFQEPFERFKAYGYLTVEPVERLWLIGGVSYNHLEMPVNFRSPPQSAGTEARELTGPKAAFVWNPLPAATLRGIYSRSLGGVSLDESFRLEPTQLAGFPQAFRTVISESVVGSVAAPEYDVMGLALDLKLGRGTYGGIQFDHIKSNIERTIGVFRAAKGEFPLTNSTTGQLLDYAEQSFSANLNRLLGDRFVVGLNYRLTQAELQSALPEIPAGKPGSWSDLTSTLHQLNGYLLLNDPSGFFARFDARYYQQSNQGYDPARPGDDFLQFDLQAGYRFFRRRAELSAGILNLTGQDYRLNPLTIYSELPRERVFTVRFSFRF